MKNCLVCRNTKLKRVTYGGGCAWIHRRVFYIPYICNTSGGVCREYYYYCIICMKLVDGDGLRPHEDKYHRKKMDYDQDIFKVNVINIKIVSFQTNTIMSLHNRNMQLFLLKLDKKVNYDISNKCPFDYLHKMEMECEIKKLLFHNNYSCILCGMYYETFPSDKLVIKHLKSCKIAEEIRRTS